MNARIEGDLYIVSREIGETLEDFSSKPLWQYRGCYKQIVTVTHRD